MKALACKMGNRKPGAGAFVVALLRQTGFGGGEEGSVRNVTAHRQQALSWVSFVLGKGWEGTQVFMSPVMHDT